MASGKRVFVPPNALRKNQSVLRPSSGKKAAHEVAGEVGQTSSSVTQQSTTPSSSQPSDFPTGCPADALTPEGIVASFSTSGDRKSVV